MFNRSKKGFTIVELIIVIAVIAVLAAVLIPTFSNLIQQAQEAKDTALVSELNKGLAMSGTKFDTMHDALTAVEENIGINVAKINATATSNEILWDSINNCFVYLKDGTVTYIPDTKSKDVAGDYDYWKISAKQEDVEAGTYSIYWNGTSLDSITVKTGFDAGEANVEKVLYKTTTSGQTITIRTNGGELEVDAESNNVYHYGIASKVLVTKVAPSSYHENGTVKGNLEVVQGHVELSAKADVQTVIVASTTADAATVTVTSGANVGAVAATTEIGKTYIESATTIPTDKKVTETLDQNTLSQFAGGIGTEASPYLIATAEQFENISLLESEMISCKEFYFEQTASFEFSKSVKSFCGVYDGKGFSITAPEVLTTKVVALFRDAYGNTTIKNLKVNSRENFGLAVYSNYLPYYNNLLIDNVTTSTVDGNVVKVNINNFAFLILNYIGDDYYESRNCAQTTKIANCVNYGSVSQEGSCAGAFIGGGFCLQAKNENHEVLIIENCQNYGNITAANSAGVIIGNPSYYDSTYKYLTENTDCTLKDIVRVDNVKSYGVITATNSIGVFGENYSDGNLLSKQYSNSAIGGTYQFNKLLDGQFSVYFADDKFSVLLGEGTDKTATYKVQLSVGTYYMDKENNYFSNGLLFDFVTEICTSGGKLLNTSKIHAYDYNTANERNIITASTKLDYKVVNGRKVALYMNGDILYMIFENVTQSTFVDSSVSVKLYAYDSNGNYISSKTITQVD